MEASLETLSTREEYLKTVDTVKEAARVYEITPEQPLMDDYSYDMLLRALKEAEVEHPQWKIENSPTETVGAGVNTLGDVVHSAPMLSLDNVFNKEELLDWHGRLVKQLGRDVKNFIVEPKLDGLALSARYVDGELSLLLLRGSGTAGENVTHNADLIVGLPKTLTQKVTLEIRGECFMSDEDFEKANLLREAHEAPAYTNPRNGAAGIIRTKKHQYPLPLNFLAYSLMDHDHLSHSDAMKYVHQLGVSVTADSKAGEMSASNIEEVFEIITKLGERRPKLGFAVDGAVVKADDPTDREDAGFTSRAPRWGIAWKYPPDTRLTTLKEIVLQLGRTGAVTPKAILEPVFVGGTTITYVTLHNSTQIAKKDLRIGDQVWVRRAGEVVPEIVSVQLKDRDESLEPWTPPSACPRCGGKLNTSMKVWRCEKGRECGLVESIHHFTAKACMEIENIGKKLTNQLVEAGLVHDVADLYSLTKEQLLSLERKKDQSANNVLEQIEASKSRPLSRLLAGLGIRHVGDVMSKTLANHYGSMDALVNATVEDVSKVDGFGTVRALSLKLELNTLSNTIKKLQEAGVNMTEPGFGQTLTGDLPLRKEDGTSKTVVVTGSIPDMSRTQAEDKVRALGGKPSKSVSKNTDILVVGENAGSKEAQALKLGVKVMKAQEFLNL